MGLLPYENWSNLVRGSMNELLSLSCFPIPAFNLLLQIYPEL